MFDDIDDEQAQAVQEALIKEGLRRARAKESLPPPSGLCFNCKDPLPGGNRFCDVYCREDWEKSIRAEAFRR